MFDRINGIPLHPLVVHGIVVLLPLALLGTILIAVRPQWRRPYGPLVVAAALIAAVLCPIATSSGEALQKRVGDPGQHAALGDQLLWFTIPLVVLSALLVLLDRRHDRSAASTSPNLLKVVAVLAVIAGLAAGAQVYRVGDSGARAAWGDAGSAISQR